MFYENGHLRAKLEDIPAPIPGPREVLIKVEVAGLNVKDYKHPLPAMYNNALNQGDDCAGTIARVGSEVKTLQLGERVAGFHVMDTPGGTFAEFALCPEHTVFRIPSSMPDEEAAKVPLAAYTASVGLYRSLQLPAPWDRSDSHAPRGKVPLTVNGAGSAVGSYALKLASMNSLIRPVLATAGSSANYVKSLHPKAIIVDYKSPTIKEDLRAALGNTHVSHVFDTTNSLNSIQYLSSVMEVGSYYTCTSKLYTNPLLGVDDSMEKALQTVHAWYEITFVGEVHGLTFMGQADTNRAQVRLLWDTVEFLTDLLHN